MATPHFYFINCKALVAMINRGGITSIKKSLVGNFVSCDVNFWLCPVSFYAISFSFLSVLVVAQLLFKFTDNSEI